MSVDPKTDVAMKVTMKCLGYIHGMHENLDILRDGTNDIDHNIEQAQIALENASMRLQQVQALMLAREPAQEDAEGSQEHEQIIDETWPAPGHCSGCWNPDKGDYVSWPDAFETNHQHLPPPTDKDHP